MNVRNGRREARQTLEPWVAKGMLSLLSQTAENISELLYASICVSEHYPELADSLERMAGEEASRFRMLGSGMLRCGLDPTVRSLLWGQGRRVGGLRGTSAEEIEAFLCNMRERTERMLEESLRVLTAPRLETEDFTATVLDGQEKQLRRLQQMLS